ncbi:uncharacterized protein LOC133907257 [Phragmites australis]|uniref:uncharacterized protein LOC133907257 n=1 Tax=Phragmites australis TaxID=29695 RepID=UPI002D790B17|nr:uncharacterized protein LOC133907257 [Phragmites australis]
MPSCVAGAAPCSCRAAATAESTRASASTPPHCTSAPPSRAALAVLPSCAIAPCFAPPPPSVLVSSPVRRPSPHGENPLPFLPSSISSVPSVLAPSQLRAAPLARAVPPPCRQPRRAAAPHAACVAPLALRAQPLATARQRVAPRRSPLHRAAQP